MAPRPHSPDCLLWAKNLKDEHTRLKVRTTELEKSLSTFRTNIEAAKGNSAAVQDISHDLTALAGRVTDIETDDQEFKSFSETFVSAMQEHLVKLNKKLDTQANKTTSLERGGTELREEYEQVEQANESLLERLKTVEEQIAKIPRVSPKVPKKNDTSSTVALGQMVESMRSGQYSDHQAIQRLQTQVQILMNLVTTQARTTAVTLQAKTPSVQEVSSPVAQVAGSPLLEKQARTQGLHIPGEH